MERGTARTERTQEARLHVVVGGLIALVALSAPLAAQAWRGQGRAQGTVLDEERRPIAGSRVTLTLQDSGAGPAPMGTDERGRWSLLGLAAGRWNLVVAAEGYATSEGFVDIVAGPGDTVTVQLLPAAATVRGMLEKGNTLLAAGEIEAARELYQRALGGLAPSELPEVLRAVARTHYLERDLKRAEETLRQALLYAPADSVTRQILVAVAGEAGRAVEIEEWLDRLDRDGAEALLAEGGGPLGWQPPVAPRRPIAATTRGRFRAVLGERGPLGAIEVFSVRYGTPMADIEATDPQAARYSLADESFELYVPDSCSAQTPCGVFVWISPGSWGGIPDAEIVAELDRRRMIWIGANRSGNQRLLWDRMALALDAASNVLSVYPTDPERVYAGGYSGGGRTASALAVLYPEVFRGGLCFMGVDFYRRVSIPARPGAYWPAAFNEPPRASLDRVKEHSRLAFVTGQYDYNRAQIEIYEELYREDGFRHLELILLPGATHYDGFPAVAFVRGMDALEPGG